MRIFALLALLTLAACASSASGRTDWRCDAGRAYSARESGSSAEVFAGGRSYNLPASGESYSDGAVSYNPATGALTGAFAGPYENCRSG